VAGVVEVMIAVVVVVVVAAADDGGGSVSFGGGMGAAGHGGGFGGAGDGGFWFSPFNRTLAACDLFGATCPSLCHNYCLSILVMIPSRVLRRAVEP
jgi:hypothetical protein